MPPIPANAISSKKRWEREIQVIDKELNFNAGLSDYLRNENVLSAGDNYHVISIFGSQSTGKSTLLNHLFNTQFDVMSEEKRQQTTQGIWLSKGNRLDDKSMAENILVMDVEGSDSGEQGEKRDFERKSALFALATSDVLMINIFENQIGLYDGANLGLLKIVFEINLQLFVKDKKNPSRSRLFFIIRDYVGRTPLSSLSNTLLEQLSKIWSEVSKSLGSSTIHDYFDFYFAALPHKLIQPKEFENEVGNLRKRFRVAEDRVKENGNTDSEQSILLPGRYHRIPADGFPRYAEGIWDQIAKNKDLDLPTQQQLLSQFRCVEISNEVCDFFDKTIDPLEKKQAEDMRVDIPTPIVNLGEIINAARSRVIADFEYQASRYNEDVYRQAKDELHTKVDSRLKALWKGQMTTSRKCGCREFSDAIIASMKEERSKSHTFNYKQIIKSRKEESVSKYEEECKAMEVEGVDWSSYEQELQQYMKDLEQVLMRLRKDEMRRLATLSERDVKKKLRNRVTLEFSMLGIRRRESASVADGNISSDNQFWDRIWNSLRETVNEYSIKFSNSAADFEAAPEEIEMGLWSLRMNSWTSLRTKIEEELEESNISRRLIEIFENNFSRDEAGLPRIWRSTDDIRGIYEHALKRSTSLIGLLSCIRIDNASEFPALQTWIGSHPSSYSSEEEADFLFIDGVDNFDRTLDEQMTLLDDLKQNSLCRHLEKRVEIKYVEAKRSSTREVARIPLFMYALMLALGWNEIMAVVLNPLYFIVLAMVGIVVYAVYHFHLSGPIIRMSQAAMSQAVEIAKEKLRDMLDNLDDSSRTRHRLGQQEGDDNDG